MSGAATGRFPEDWDGREIARLQHPRSDCPFADRELRGRMLLFVRAGLSPGSKATSLPDYSFRQTARTRYAESVRNRPGRFQEVGLASNLNNVLRLDGLLMKTPQTGSIDGNAATHFETICAQGVCVQLNAQQSLPLPLADKLIVLRDGMLAIDAMPAKGKLQVLDFLMAGDVVSSSKILSARKVSLRAITRSTAIVLQPLDLSPTALASECWSFLVEQCFNQIARVNMHQLMTGRLETEARVASFILALALRGERDRSSDDKREVVVALPMSRVDIANYLVINCDTLSRTMMKFSDCGIVERLSRHSVLVKDLPALQKKSPISALLSDVFTRMYDKQAEVFSPGDGSNELTARIADRGRADAPDSLSRVALSAAE